MSRKSSVSRLFGTSVFLSTTITLAFLVCMWGLAFAAGDKKVAVLELQNKADVTDDEASYLTDKVRDAASRILSRRGFLVITRESLQELVPPGTDLSRCSDAQCEVEIGRMIGADYIVTGELIKFSGEFRANLKAHHSQTGAFLGAEASAGIALKDLEQSISTSSSRLFGKVLVHAGGKPVSPGANMVPPSEIGEQPAGDWDMPADSQVVVRFESEPTEAVVLVDGRLICQQTPCSKALNEGTATISMQRERYQGRQEIVQIAEGMSPINWELSPSFGRLTVNSDPPGIRILINNEPVGSTPLLNKELDPGVYEVLVSDIRYYDKGERFSIAAGETKSLDVELVPRKGDLHVMARDQNDNDLAADVYLDGTRIGSAPGTFRVVIGQHEVEVRAPNGKWTGTVEVAEKQTIEIAAEIHLMKADTQITTSEFFFVDESSELMWQSKPTGGKMTWSEAKSHCSRLKLGEHDDWQLPTISQLRTLIRDCTSTAANGSCSAGKQMRKINLAQCRGCPKKKGPGPEGLYWEIPQAEPCCRYWSSSSNTVGGTYSWGVDFANAKVFGRGAEAKYFARCVRNSK
jgi:TolB-like protein